MYARKNRNGLPLLVTALGVAGLVLRQILYAVALDDRGLLPVGHPLEIVLGILTAAALAIIVAGVWKLDGAKDYADNFFPSLPAGIGHILGAMGIWLTVLRGAPLLSGSLGQIWKALGILAGPCLVIAGFDRVRGRKPFFLLHVIPCLFLVFHIINHYQVWSSNPQLLDYGFTLFGTMALMFFGFYTAAFDCGIERRRMQLGMGLAAVYLCIVNLSFEGYFWLYLGGIVWAITGLCTLNPKPLPPQEQAPQAEEAP